MGKDAVSADKNERGTLPETLEICLKISNTGPYSLDVAASAENHVCGAYYTRESNGLVRPWVGNVWCNPPFDQIPEFVAKAWREWNAARVATISMLLPANRTEQPFWQEMVEPHRDKAQGGLKVHFLPKRIKFKGFAGSPPFGCVLLVWK